MRRIRELAQELDTPLAPGAKIYIQPDWSQAYPWLVQGITGSDFDLRLFGDAPAGQVMARWDQLRGALGFSAAHHARQVHGNRVVEATSVGEPGVSIFAEADGHATSVSGVLLTVAVADCVPVTLVDPETRQVAVVHAGWRGIVAGILDEGVTALVRMGAAPDRLRVHLGPHICGDCYEVGPEVHEALGGPVPTAPQPVSLAEALERRAVALGIKTNLITVSAMCTRCDGSLFYSHRGGGVGRQVSVVGVRPS